MRARCAARVVLIVGFVSAAGFADDTASSAPARTSPTATFLLDPFPFFGEEWSLDVRPVPWLGVGPVAFLGTEEALRVAPSDKDSVAEYGAGLQVRAHPFDRDTPFGFGGFVFGVEGRYMHAEHSAPIILPPFSPSPGWTATPFLGGWAIYGSNFTVAFETGVAFSMKGEPTSFHLDGKLPPKWFERALIGWSF